MTLSAIDRVRLEALLGMLGSEHIGERDNAAKAVEQFRRDRGLSWADLLARHHLKGAFFDPQEYRQRHTQHAPDAEIIGPRYDAQDAIWRWSMVAAIAVVALISLTSLQQQRFARPANPPETLADRRCPAGQEGSVWPVCEPSLNAVRAPLERPPPAAVDAGSPPQKAVAQGLADRKLWEAWHKAAPAGLCSGRFTRNLEELKSACLTAQKLLKQFDERRRTDPAYRRGWNSLPS